jgi:GrpB-like predicted nucleotidyltransferase (UPF0157 family)
VRVEIVDHRPEWPERFRELASRIRVLLGTRATAIHHIGSTSVPGLAAKDVIDIQVAVEDLHPLPPIHDALVQDGWTFMEDNDDRRKWFFHLDAPDGRRLSNLHVRRDGEFSQQAALLLRDHLREVPDARLRYEATKRGLATRDWPTVEDYAIAKGDCVWALLREADVRSFATGWRPGPSEA